MAIIKTSAIVLRYANYRDYDRILTLFSGEYGKMTAAAHACRRPKSPLLPCSQLFCFGEYILKQKGERLSVMQCDVTDSFFDLGTNIEKFADASFILNICEELSTQGEGSPALFPLLVRALSALCYSPKDPVAVMAHFLLNALDATGYRPSLDRCAVCGREGRQAFFSTQYGGSVCEKCRGTDAVRLNANVLDTMETMLSAEIGELKDIDPAGLHPIIALIHPYLEYRLERRFKSGEFMRLIGSAKGKAASPKNL